MSMERTGEVWETAGWPIRKSRKKNERKTEFMSSMFPCQILSPVSSTQSHINLYSTRHPWCDLNLLSPDGTARHTPGHGTLAPKIPLVEPRHKPKGHTPFSWPYRKIWLWGYPASPIELDIYGQQILNYPLRWEWDAAINCNGSVSWSSDGSIWQFQHIPPGKSPLQRATVSGCRHR